MALANEIPIAHICFQQMFYGIKTSTLIDATRSFFTQDFHIFYRFFNINLLSYEIIFILS